MIYQFSIYILFYSSVIFFIIIVVTSKFASNSQYKQDIDCENLTKFKNKNHPGTERSNLITSKMDLVLYFINDSHTFPLLLIFPLQIHYCYITDYENIKIIIKKRCQLWDFSSDVTACKNELM